MAVWVNAKARPDAAGQLLATRVEAGGYQCRRRGCNKCQRGENNGSQLPVLTTHVVNAVRRQTERPKGEPSPHAPRRSARHAKAPSASVPAATLTCRMQGRSQIWLQAKLDGQDCHHRQA